MQIENELGDHPPQVLVQLVGVVLDLRQELEVVTPGRVRPGELLNEFLHADSLEELGCSQTRLTRPFHTLADQEGGPDVLQLVLELLDPGGQLRLA